MYCCARGVRAAVACFTRLALQLCLDQCWCCWCWCWHQTPGWQQLSCGAGHLLQERQRQKKQVDQLKREAEEQRQQQQQEEQRRREQQHQQQQQAADKRRYAIAKAMRGCHSCGLGHALLLLLQLLLVVALPIS